MNNYEEKTIASKTVFEGKVITLQVEDVELPDGKRAVRELIRHPGAVAVLPITKEGKFIFIKQYRKALGHMLIEIPAGKMEPGEKPEMTAKRELEEETGYGCDELTYMQSFATSPGFADEVIHVYAAQNIFAIEEPAAGDDDEFIELMEVTMKEAEQMMEKGEIFDAKTAFAILYAKLHFLA